MTTTSEITQETLDEITRVIKSTSGINVATGFAGVDLGPIVSLIPVNTPTYDMTSRVMAPMGAPAATWRVSLDLNSSQPDPFVGDDAGGGSVLFAEHDMLAPFRPVRVTGNVTQDAIDKARGYDDAKARATAGTLRQWRIGDNKAILGGNAVALPTIGTVALTAATTGGTIASGVSLYVKAAARSGRNYFWGGSSIASAAASAGVGSSTSTNTVTASVAAVRGAVAYDWYTSSDGGVTYYYTTTTSINAVTFTKTLSANAAVPSVLTMPGLYKTAPTAVPVADTSFSAKNYNGLITSLTQDYASTGSFATFGTGDLASPTSWISLDGATLTGAAQGITELDQLNASIFATAQCGPSMYLCAAQQATDMAAKIMGTNQAQTFLAPGDDRTSLIGGTAMGRYVNRTTTEVIKVRVDPHLPPGTILALTETIPFPDAGYAANMEVRVLREVGEIPYGASTSDGAAGQGPREVWDCSSMESFLLRAPSTCGVLTNIKQG